MNRLNTGAVTLVLSLFVVAAAEDSRHVPFRVLLRAPYYLPSLSDTSASGLMAPAFAVLTSEEQEREFLATYATRLSVHDGDSIVQPAPMPQIDYNSETAVVIAFGTWTSSTWICLDSVVENSMCVVFATAVSPPPSILNDNSIANPVLVAAIQGAKRKVTLAPLRKVNSEP